MWWGWGTAGPGLPGSLQIVSEENAKGPPARVQNRSRGLQAQLRPPLQVLWHVLIGCLALGRQAGEAVRAEAGMEVPKGLLPIVAGPHSTYQIRRLLAVAAAAARARMTGTLFKKGIEGPPPLPSSPGSQIFVVGGGANELVVLVVVSGEHGGNSGQGQDWSHPELGFHEAHCSCFLIRLVLPLPSCFPRLVSDHCTW